MHYSINIIHYLYSFLKRKLPCAAIKSLSFNLIFVSAFQNYSKLFRCKLNKNWTVYSNTVALSVFSFTPGIRLLNIIQECFIRNLLFLSFSLCNSREDLLITLRFFALSFSFFTSCSSVKLTFDPTSSFVSFFFNRDEQDNK